MCWKCYGGLSNEKAVQGLKEQVDFEEYNTASVEFLLYSAIGLYGPEARELGIEKTNKFIEFLKTKPNFYLPKYGLEQMYHPTFLKNVLQFIEGFEFDYEFNTLCDYGYDVSDVKWIKYEDEKTEKTKENDYKLKVLHILSLRMEDLQKQLEDSSIMYRIEKFMNKPVREPPSLPFAAMIGVGVGVSIRYLFKGQIF